MSNRKEVWTVCPRGEGKKDYWLRVGTAFENRDGSWSIVLDALPTNNKLIVREERSREERGDSPPRRQARGSSGSAHEDFGGSDGGHGDDIPF